MAEPTPQAEPAPQLRRGVEEGRMFLLFAAIGAAAFVFDATMLKIFMGLSLGPALGRVLSLFLSMNFTFVVNRKVTFAKYRGRPLAQQWALYMAANSLGAGINYLVYLVLIASLLAGRPFLAVAAGSIAGLAFNFTASRLTAFRR
jgi:putative flippase GtrA